MTLYELASRPQDRPAAIDEDGRELTYRDLAAGAESLRSVLRERSLVFVLARNTLGCVAAVAGLLEARMVPLLLDADSQPSRIADLRAAYLPDAILAPNDFEPIADFDSSAGWVHPAGLDYEMRLATVPTGVKVHGDLALLLSTSGSTGSPKLVRQSYQNLQSNGASIIEYLDITADERPITSLPLHYTYGFSVFNSHLMAGATLLVTDRSVMEKGLWAMINDHKATSFAGVPYTYQMLQRLRFSRMDIPSLRTMTQAGGRLAPEIIREFAELSFARGFNFVVMYGQTEATARMSYVPPHLALEKAGSIGIPIPSGSFTLVDTQGDQILDAHVDGQLCYHGPNVAMGYAESAEDLGRGNDWNGVLFTGDVGQRDEDGFFYITGRLSRFVKLFGKRVGLDDLERIVLDVVDEAACTGADDAVAVWITNADAVDQVRTTLAERTGIHPSAFSVKWIDAIPRSSAGKPDYQTLKVQESL